MMAMIGFSFLFLVSLNWWVRQACKKHQRNQPSLSKSCFREV
eukprot:COSAG06_NODE_71796_length_179_cov_43.762500_1_plen_41_part_10